MINSKPLSVDDYTAPPKHLSPRSKALWRALGPRHAVTLGRQTLLQAALEALDRADDAREIIARDGLTTETKSTGAVHVNPAVKIERESRQAFAKLWKQLGLDFQYNN